MGNTSFCALELIVTNALSETVFDQITANTLTKPTRCDCTCSHKRGRSPLDRIANFMNLTKEFCRELILQEQSFSQENTIGFHDFTEIERLEWEQGACSCIDSVKLMNVLPRLESIIIRANCVQRSPVNGVGEFILQDLKALTELRIESNCFTNYTTFRICSRKRGIGLR